MPETVFLLTCEHGGNRVPAAYRPLFPRAGGVLAGHRGWDPGARVLARALAAGLDAGLFVATTSRLLVDLNRSPGHPDLFSRYTRVLAPDRRQAILDRYYTPYREAVEAAVRAHCRAGRRVVHLSAHSFTPRLHGAERRADLGLLYDPRRAGERRFCRRLQLCLRGVLPDLRVRRNYPYRGRADGLTTWLRRRFNAESYLGIELELNQRIARGDARRWQPLRRDLVACIRAAAEIPKP